MFYYNGSELAGTLIAIGCACVIVLSIVFLIIATSSDDTTKKGRSESDNQMTKYSEAIRSSHSYPPYTYTYTRKEQKMLDQAANCCSICGEIWNESNLLNFQFSSDRSIKVCPDCMKAHDAYIKQNSQKEESKNVRKSRIS